MATYGVVLRSRSGSIMRTTQEATRLPAAASAVAAEFSGWELVAVQLQDGDNYLGMDQ